MDSVNTALLSTRQSVNVYTCVFVICLLGVSAVQTLDTTNSATPPSDAIGNMETIDSFWEYYFLSHLQNALNRRISQLKDDQRKALEEDDTESESESSERQKRKVLGVAGLDNFDVMTKTLDRTRNRNRFPMMMSVPRMNTNRLRMLMESQGKRK